jgi:hypothetical protein
MPRVIRSASKSRTPYIPIESEIRSLKTIAEHTRVPLPLVKVHGTLFDTPTYAENTKIMKRSTFIQHLAMIHP